MRALLAPTKAALSLLYPHHCVGCRASTVLDLETQLCSQCTQGLFRIDTLACFRCGYPAFQHQRSSMQRCPRCRLPEFPLDTVRSLYGYGGLLGDLLHQYKYHQQRSAGVVLKHLMATGSEKAGLPRDDYDLVLPVPLHRKRLQERGFNQAYELLKAIPEVRSSQTPLRLLQRVRHASSQVGSGLNQRLQNLQETFTLKPSQTSLCQGRSVLLVDDVWTTGATLMACARLLRDAGARKVDALTLSRAIL